jgi:hypothetical protein
MDQTPTICFELVRDLTFLTKRGRIEWSEGDSLADKDNNREYIADVPGRDGTHLRFDLVMMWKPSKDGGYQHIVLGADGVFVTECNQPREWWDVVPPLWELFEAVYGIEPGFTVAAKDQCETVEKAAHRLSNLVAGRE